MSNSNTELSKKLWESVLHFWFEELKAKHWFVSSKELDKTIADRFGDALDALTVFSERLPLDKAVDETIDETFLSDIAIESPLDVLAAILITDQFSRNIHRNSLKAFATDSLALALATHLIKDNALSGMTKDQIQFAVMPFMHAENLVAQQTCIDLFTEHEIVHGLSSAHEHFEIIKRFGRYPYRNITLGRTSTAEELAYLQDGKSFGQG